jgi:hypothetical protein
MSDAIPPGQDGQRGGAIILSRVSGGGGTTPTQRRQLSKHRLLTGARLAPSQGRTVREGAVGGSKRSLSLIGAAHGQGSLPSWTKVDARSSVGNRVRASTAANGRSQPRAVGSPSRGASAIAAGTRTATSPESHAPTRGSHRRGLADGDRDTSIDQEGMRVLTPMPIPV